MAAKDHNALGLIETRGLVAAIEAADAMAKAADVRILGVENTVAAYMTVQVSGETAAVQAAVDAGVIAASQVGEVIASHVIPRPSRSVFRLQRMESPEKTYRADTESVTHKASTRLRSGKIESLTVREMRALARRTPGLSIQGREIARANKRQLVHALLNSNDQRSDG